MTVDGKTTAYSYDETGNVVRTTDPAGRIKTLTFDARNRATGTRYEMPGATAIVVGQTFDVRDRRTSMTDSTGMHRYEYDAKGNLVGRALPAEPSPMTRRRVSDRDYPDGTTVDYRLDDAGA
jgi:YD repeat-containing protein